MGKVQDVLRKMAGKNPNMMPPHFSAVLHVMPSKQLFAGQGELPWSSPA